MLAATLATGAELPPPAVTAVQVAVAVWLPPLPSLAVTTTRIYLWASDVVSV